MPRKATPIDVSAMPEVSRLVREVTRTGRARLLEVNGDAALLSPAPPRRRATKTASRARLGAAFLAARGALPPLSPPRTLSEMTEIAAEEAAQAATREGLPGQ